MVELRHQGMTMAAIAAHVGMSLKGVWARSGAPGEACRPFRECCADPDDSMAEDAGGRAN
jgi:hypothetical protein